MKRFLLALSILLLYPPSAFSAAPGSPPAFQVLSQPVTLGQITGQFSSCGAGEALTCDGTGEPITAFDEAGDYTLTGTWDWSGVNGATSWPTFNQDTTGKADTCGNADTVTAGVYTTGAGTVFLAPDGDGSGIDLSTPPAIGGTTPAAITGTTVTGSEFVSSAADGEHIAKIPCNTNGNTPTLTGSSGFYGEEDGSGNCIVYYFEEAAKIGPLAPALTYHQAAYVDPDALYANEAGIVVLDPKTIAAITINEIYAALNEDPTTELTITCYHKTAAIGYTGGTQIDTNDTVSGTFDALSNFDDATIPAGSKIWCVVADDPDATTVGIEIAITGTYE